MKRLAITLDQLASRSNQALATWKAARGKRERPAVEKGQARLDDDLTQLSRDILARRSLHGRSSQSVVHHPKRRTITAACLADRVLHHAILKHLQAELHLRLKDKVIIRPNAQGLRFCGCRIKPGVVLPCRRKQRLYRAVAQRVGRAEASGAVTGPHLQRAHDVAAASLLPAQSLLFRRSLWWGGQQPPLGSDL